MKFRNLLVLVVMAGAVIASGAAMAGDDVRQDVIERAHEQ